MSFIIIYGFSGERDLKINYDCDSKILLIEPRKEKLDIIYRLPNETKNRFILIPKVLHELNSQTETILYNYNREVNINPICYSLESLDSYKLNNRQNVFSTSLPNIIIQNNIKCISKFIININITNIEKILESLKPFQHIINEIFIPKTTSIILPYYLVKKDPLDSLHEENYSTFSVFTTKYTHTKDVTSRIVILTKNIPEYLESRWNILLNQYQFDVIYCTSNSKDLIGVLDDYFKQDNLIKHDFVFILNPEVLSQNCIDNSDFDFTDDYQEDVLYINQSKMSFKGTRNTLYLLFDILRSSEYNTGLTELKNKKGKLFKIFEKGYMLEYIKKLFRVINF